MGFLQTIVVGIVMIFIVLLLVQLFYRNFMGGESGDDGSLCSRCALARAREGTEEDFRHVVRETDAVHDDSDSDEDIEEE